MSNDLEITVEATPELAEASTDAMAAAQDVSNTPSETPPVTGSQPEGGVADSNDSPPVAATPIGGGEGPADPQPEETPVERVPNVTTGEVPVNPRAIAWLRENPERHQEFEAVYGPGSHLPYLDKARVFQGENGEPVVVEAEEEKEGWSVWGIPKGLSHGVTKGINSALSMLDEINDLGPQVYLGTDPETGEPTIKYIAADAPKQDKERGHLPKAPKAAAPETVLGQLTSGVAQFGTGWIATGPLGKVFQGAKATGGALKGAQAWWKSFAATSTRAAAVDFAFFDAAEGNLSTMVNELEPFGWDLDNFVSEALDSKRADSFWEGRFRNMAEGFLLGSQVEGFLHVLKGARMGRKLKAAKAKGDEKLLKSVEKDFERYILKNEELAKAEAKAAGKTLTPEELLRKQQSEMLESFETSRMAERLGEDVLSEVGDALEGFVDYQAWDDIVGSELVRDVGGGAKHAKQVHTNSLKAGKAGMLEEEDLGSELYDLARLVNGAIKKANPTWGDKIPWADQDKIAMKMFEDTHLGELIKKARAQVPGDDVVPMHIVADAYLERLGTEVVRAERLVSAQLKSAGRYAKGTSARTIAEETARGLKEKRDDLMRKYVALFMPVNDAKSKWGRQMQAAGRLPNSKMAKQAFEEFDGNFDDMALKMRMIYDNNGALRKMAAQFAKHQSWDVVNEFYINSLLSGPATHIVNLTSNAIETALRPAEMLVGGALSRNPKMRAEALSRYYAYGMYAKESARMMLKTLYMGENILDPMHKVMDAPSGAIHWGKVEGDKSHVRAVKSAVNAVGEVIRTPSRLLMGGDEFFKQMNFRASLHGQLAREALEAGMSSKKTAKYIKDNFDRLITEFADHRHYQVKGTKPPKPMDRRLRSALKEARLATFTAELTPGSAGKKISELVNAVPILRQILPFVRTPSNLMGHVAERFPLTQINKLTGAVGDMTGVNAPQVGFHRAKMAQLRGGDSAAIQDARELIGSMVMLGFAFHAMDGNVTGKLSDNYNERSNKLNAGGQDYSISWKTDDSDTRAYLQLNRLDPRVQPGFIAADIVKRWRDGSEEAQPLEDKLTSVLAAFSQNIFSKSYAKGLSDFMTTIGSGEESKWWKFASRHINAYQPFSAFNRQVNWGGASHEIKEPYTVWESFIQNIDDRGIDRRFNALGEVIRKPYLGDVVQSPFAFTKTRSEPALRALAFVGGAVQPVPYRDTWTLGLDLRKYEAEDGFSLYHKFQEKMGNPGDDMPSLVDAVSEELVEEPDIGVMVQSMVAGQEAKSDLVKLINNVREEYIEIAREWILESEQSDPAFRRFREDLQAEELRRELTEDNADTTGTPEHTKANEIRNHITMGQGQ